MSSSGASNVKGKMRTAMHLKKVDKLREEAQAKSAGVAAKPEYGTGSLSKEDFELLRGDDIRPYVRNFFKKFGYTFPDPDKVYECGYCLLRAMGLEDGYISEPDMAAAKQARLSWETRRAKKRAVHST
jgi:hypothetical protein